MDRLGPVAPGDQAVTIPPMDLQGASPGCRPSRREERWKKERKAVREGEMSEFFLKLYERGLSYRGAPKAKSQPAPEGSPKEPGASPGPRPEKDDRPRPSRVGLAKAGPGERSAQGAGGPSGAGPKECPPKKGHPAPKRGLNLVWKKPGGQQVNPGRPGRPEDTATVGKGVRSSRSTLKSLRSRAPQPAGGLDKMLAEPSRNMMRGEPAHSPLSRAKVAPSGVAPKTPPGTVKTKALVGSKRTKKTVRQSSSVKDNALQKTTRRKGSQEGSLKEKGTALAAVHGNMEIRQKVSQTFGERSPPDLDNLLPGDLIEIFRFGYQHWAIYVGNGYVIHLAPPSELAGPGCASLMSTLTDKAWVKKELLKDVVGKCQYRVNNKHDAKYPPLPPSKIVRRAEERVGQELAYKITSENCEHFVTELRYGVAKSDQVRDAVVGVGIAGLGLAAALGIFSFAMAKKKKNQQNQ